MPDEPRSWLLRFGNVVGAAALGSALATAPAALRLELTPGACSMTGAWAVLIALALVPMSLAVLALGRARGGFAALRGSQGMTPVVAVLAWLVATFVALVGLGAVLRARTHHRALGGVTYAVAAFVVSFGLALAIARASSMARKASASTRWGLAVAAATVLGFLVAFARHRLSQGGGFANGTGTRLVDGLAFALAAFLASARPLASSKLFALVGPPAATVLLMLGWSSWRACPSLQATLEERAPVFGAVVRRVAPRQTPPGPPSLSAPH